MSSPIIRRNRESDLGSNNGQNSNEKMNLVKDLFSKINLYNPQTHNLIDLTTAYSYQQLLLLKRVLSDHDKLKKIIGKEEFEKILKFKLVDEALVGGYKDKSILKFQSAESISSLWNTFAVVSTGPYGAILGFGAYHLFLSAPIGVIIGGISFIASLPMAINKYKSDKAKLKSMLEKMVIDELLVRIMQAIDISLDNQINSLQEKISTEIGEGLPLLNGSGFIEPALINHGSLLNGSKREIQNLITGFKEKLSLLVSENKIRGRKYKDYVESLETLNQLVGDTRLIQQVDQSLNLLPTVGIRRQASVILAPPQIRAEENQGMLVESNTQVDEKNLKFSKYCKDNKMETAATLFGGIGTVGALSVITTLGVTALKVFGITAILGVSLVSLPVMITLFSVSVAAAAGICAFNLYNRKKQWQREQKANLINQQKIKLSDDYENKDSTVNKLKKMASALKTIFDITREIKDKEESKAMNPVQTELKPVSTSTTTYIYHATPVEPNTAGFFSVKNNFYNSNKLVEDNLGKSNNPTAVNG